MGGPVGAAEPRPIQAEHHGNLLDSDVVDDLIEGIVALLYSNEHLPVNIGNQHEMTILQFAETINRLTENKGGVTYVKDARSVRDPQQRQPDITRARTILKWEPKVGLEEGLHKTIPYFRKKLGLG